MEKMGPMASLMKNAGAFVIKRSFQPQPNNNKGILKYCVHCNSIVIIVKVMYLFQQIQISVY